MLYFIPQGPSHSSRPFSALVEAAEAMSRGDELQQPSLEDNAYFILKNDHDYVSQVSKSFEGVSQSLESVANVSCKSDEPLLPSDQSETNFTVNSESPEEDANNEELKTETESDLDSNQDEDMLELTDTGEVIIEKDAESNHEPPTYGVKENETEGTETELLKCDKCSYTTTVQYYLTEHQTYMHFKGVMQCPTCDKVFNNIRYLRRHQLTHADNSYYCEICGKIYKCQKAFKHHSKTHNKDFVKEVFSCNECEKTFASNFNLTAHKKSEHQGIKKNFLCQTCGKSFTSKKTMLQHLNIHTGKRPYVCDICDKDFTYESALRDHKNTHEKNKIFKCDFPDCEKTFYQRSALKIHKSIHKDSKDFVCKECGRGFTQKQALQRHERSHKGLKPFKCVYCSRTFGDPSVIRRHIQLVHKVNKDIEKWREDVVELTPEELKAETEAAIKQTIQPRQVILPSQMPTVVQMISSSTPVKPSTGTSLLRQEPSVVSSQPVIVEPGTDIAQRNMLSNSASNKLLTMSAVPVQGALIQCQYPMPNFETTFLIRPSTVIQFSKPENTDNTQFLRADTNNQNITITQDHEHVQFLNENMDGTFSSVTESAQKGKTFEPYLRPALDAAVVSEQNLEQLKPDGTLAETSMSLSDEGVGDNELTTESLTQFYSYYTSLTGQLTSPDSTQIKP